jgi:hypothetical protein
MDPSAEKQALFDRKREDMVSLFPSLWNKLISEWKSPGSDNRAWLMYSANYLIRTGEVRSAIDPLRLKNRLPSAPEMDISYDLKDLEIVLLTHSHKDHLDLELIHNLRKLPILWVLPIHLLDLETETGLSRAKVIVPKPLEPFEFKGIKITPFDGLHWESDPEKPGGYRGVPATSYLVEFDGKRWLFSGDIRTYDSSLLPSFGNVDGAFVHLWLGCFSALLEETPLLDSYCCFCKGLHSQRIIITHLQEFGREIHEFWDDTHFQLDKQSLQGITPDIEVGSAVIGDFVNL